MKRKSLASVALLLALILSFAPVLADSDPGIPLDPFTADFAFFCLGWDGEWNPNKLTVISRFGNTLIGDADGIIMKVKKDGNDLSILKLSVPMVSGMELNDMLRIISMMAALDYEKPKTKAERSEILSQIMESIKESTNTLKDAIYTFDGSSVFAMQHKTHTYYWETIDGTTYLCVDP